MGKGGKEVRCQLPHPSKGQGSFAALAKAVSPWRPRRAGPAGAAPKFQSFPAMGRPPGPSGIPGDLDRERAFKWMGEGELGNHFSALNSWTSQELYRSLCLLHTDVRESGS